MYENPKTHFAERKPAIAASIGALLLLCLAGCPRHLPPAVVAQHHTPPSTPTAGTPRWVESISDEATWRAVSTRPENEVFARTETAKFLIDLEDERHLYFPDTHRWPIHFDFASEFLSSAHAVEDHYAFNIREYRRPERRFLLGSIVHYLDGDLWTMELISGDNMDGERIFSAWKQIHDATYFGPQLKFRPLSEMHEQNIAGLGARLPTIGRDAVFAGLRYEPITSGIAYGYIRLVTGDLDVGSVSPTDILVTADVPEDLPVCAALVTSKLQAPLAHVAVLSRNRGTPDMALRDAVTDADFVAHAGQLVRLDVGPQEYAIQAATQEEADAHWAAIRPRPADISAPDPSVTELVDVCSVHFSDTASVGAKAAQLGDVCSVFPNATPGGFVIPVNHYLAHLHAAHLADSLPTMLADPAFNSDRALRASRLEAFRRTIQQASIDPRLLAQVRAKVAALGNVRSIFRSSTNAEDLAGFNGAGLYESLVVPAHPTDDDIARAIRGVWASVWTLRGVEERNWYRIDHSRVAMAILVQPFVAPTIGGGVAITANPFNEARPAVFINVQAQGGSVTGAHGDELPEQHLVYTYSGQFEPEVLSRSSLMNGETILPEADVLALTNTLTTLHAALVPRYANNANALDVEFFVRTDHSIVIVQARPYRIVYTEGQRWVY